MLTVSTSLHNFKLTTVTSRRWIQEHVDQEAGDCSSGPDPRSFGKQQAAHSGFGSGP